MKMIDIGRLNKTRPHLFADAVEIRLIFSAGMPISTTDMYSMVSVAIDTADDLLNLDEEDIDDNDYDDNLSGSEITAREQRCADECFAQIKYRAAEFGDDYPFEIDEDRVSLKPSLQNNHKNYLVLLFASRSRTFKIKGIAQSLSDAFERVCVAALTGLMSADADVVMFGPKSDDRKTRFNTNLRLAIPLLADFIGAKVSPSWVQSEESTQGDGKLDLIGVHKLDDSEGGWHVFLGQCAAMEDESNWEKKRMEADAKYHTGRFHFHVSPQGILFVPVCYRQSNGRWVKPTFTAGMIFMDRFRIISHMNDNKACESFVAKFLEDTFQITG